MGIGVLFALTLPGLVVFLVVVATVEHVWSRLGRRSPVYRRERHALSAGGMDVFSAALFPGKAVDLEQQRVREMTRDDVDDGAPPYRRIDLDSGVAHIDVPRRGERRREAAVPEMQPAGHLRDTRASYRRTGRTDEGGAAMTTSTKERKARSERTRATWICDNCHGRSAGLRKRCVECGTLRY